MRRITLILITISLSVCFGGPVCAQKVNSAAEKKLEKIREALNNLDWTAAKEQSDNLVARYPSWAEAWLVRSEAYQAAGDLKISRESLERLVRLDSTGYPEAYRWLAQWGFNGGDYSSALADLNRYRELLKDTLSLTDNYRTLKESIAFALKQIQNPEANEPAKLQGPVNTKDDEYFPSLSVDGSMLAFTRQAAAPTAEPNKPGQEILLYTYLKDSRFSTPVAFPGPINTGGNEGTTSLSQDGRIMFFTACNRPDTKGGCDLYYSIRSGDRWSDPRNAGNPLNTRYWESTPFLAPDGKTLFFSSNRPGGFGGMDIWVTTLQSNGSWSVPKNLGKEINTSSDEMSPCLLIDGRMLFFASNGHVGMGGFDLYRCDLPTRSGIQNLGYPVNTHANEDAITINAAVNSALIASNRDTLTGKDIYEIKLEGLLPVMEAITLSGTVTDRVTGKPLSARIEIQPHGDSLVSRVDSDPADGSFLIGVPQKDAYRIGASSPGYLPYTFYYQRSAEGDLKKITHTIKMEPVRTGATIILQNIFFGVDSFEILPESNPDLEEILRLFAANPGMVVEIAGYTDNSGTEEHNRTLSQNRAESIRKYLIGHGIDPGQLVAKGYGESNPVASNDNEEGKRLNRRTEMKVLHVR